MMSGLRSPTRRAAHNARMVASGVAARDWSDALEMIAECTDAEAREIAREDPSLIWLDDADIAEAISLEQIRTLRTEAREAGDDMQLLVCERALETGEWSIDDWTGGGHRLTDAQERQLSTMTDTQARAICALAILAARS